MIYIDGVKVDNRGKEKQLRNEIEKLNQEVFDLKMELASKMQEVEMLIEKIHKMGGRIRK